jgi:acetyltransferase-like isoleucine patch superfamily enzyme
VDRKTKAEYLVRLGVRVGFGAVLGGQAVVRRRVRAVKARWLP